MNTDVYSSTYNSEFFFDLSRMSRARIVILYNINFRYLSPVLNLKLRSLYLKKGVLFYSIGSLNVSNNYYVKNLGLTMTTLFKIISGNH